MPRTLSRIGRGLKGLKKKFSGIPTRLQMHAANNLGVILSDEVARYKKVRKDSLDNLDKYYDGEQYDHLMPWNKAAQEDEFIPIRDRKPRVTYNVAKVLVDKVGGKITGDKVFPTFKVEDSPEDSDFFRVVQQAAGFRRNLVEPIRAALLCGSAFVRYFLVEGDIVMEWAKTKYCYPKFDVSGELEEIEIRYVFEDANDMDARGKFKLKWYKWVGTKTADILYDTPEYREGSIPTFKVVERNDHELGWVQGEWIRTSKEQHGPDGKSIVEPVLDFIDELNYSLSQTSQAIGYNQDPQLAIKGMDVDELDKLIKSAEKAWSLGRDGEAKFVESTMNGVTAAAEARQEFRSLMLDVVRVVLHDPEKMVGSAQSAKALEVLNAPLVELVDDLRTSFEPSIKNLLMKIGLTCTLMNAQGFETVITMPDDYHPKSLNLVAVWPPMFPLTIEDIQKKVMAVTAATGAKVLSRESGMKWIAPDFGIEDLEEEKRKIESEPELNPFGTF